MSNNSFMPLTAAPFTEHGSPLRRERADGRRSDAHDPCGVLGSVAVQVEQDEGGSLPRGEREEHPADVVADLNVIERVADGADRHHAS
jgi:hypothetical protein